MIDREEVVWDKDEGKSVMKLQISKKKNRVGGPVHSNTCGAAPSTTIQ